MRATWWLAASALGAMMMAAAAGCSDPAPRFGPPGGLGGKSLPQPLVDLDAAPPPKTDSGPPAACADAGVCAKTWSKDVFPLFAAGGTYKCADANCHGGLQAPKFTDAKSAYTVLTAWTASDKSAACTANAASCRPYILPCSTDLTKSTMDCNLTSLACGGQMPLQGPPVNAPPLAAADRQTIETWLGCGAPND